MSTRKTLREFFQNEKGISQDTLSYRLSSGNGVIQEGDDLDIDVVSGEKLIDFSDKSSGLLGDYLSFKTKNNIRSLKGGNFEAASAIRGNYSHTNPDELSDSPFIRQGTQEAAVISSYSNSGYFGPDLEKVIDKIGAENTTADPLSQIQGQNLGKSNSVVVNSQGEDNPIVQLSQNMLINNNRFSPTNKSKVFKPNNISDVQFESGENEAGTVQVQNEFASYDKSTFITNLEELKSIGESLILKAGGWDTGISPGSSADPDDFSLQNSAISKNGISNIDINSIESKNAFGFPKDSQGNSARYGKGESSVSKRKFSQASLFNDKINFSGKNYKILKVQAAIGLIAVKKSFEMLFKQLEILSIKSRTENGVALLDQTDESIEIKRLGKYRPDSLETVDFLKKKLFVKTDYSYFDCVEIGMSVMFSETALESDNERIVARRSKFIDSDASYWISILVSALKRSNNIIDTVDKFQDDALSNSILFINALKNNAMIRLMNAFATVGDIHLKSQDGKTFTNNRTNKTMRDIDGLPSIPATRIMKSRSGKKNNLNLSWADSHLPSAYILPLNVIGATIDMDTVRKGVNPARGMLGSGLANKTYTAPMLHGSFNRIPSEVVRELEDRMEAEYVPFYIQDLRTNEVIAFQAFLTDLSDQISTNYNESTGYGRLDTIKTYKNTTRSISVGFKLISTNPQDFDEMWYKINKLVTLFYPQWTPGDTITKGESYSNVPILSSGADAIFKQPFSQVIGATPVVRMRIGDIIKSNYSKFNLSRIFGAGDIGTNLRPTSNNRLLDTLSKFTNPTGIGASIPGIGRVNIRDVIINTIAKQFGSPVGNYAAGAKIGKTINSMLGANEDIINTAIDKIASAAISDISGGLVNGFVNQIVLRETIFKMIDPALVNNLENSVYGYTIGSFTFLRIRPERPYIAIDGSQFLFTRNVRVKVLKRTVKNINIGQKTANKQQDNTFKSYTEYEVVVDDPNLNAVNGKNIVVVHSDLEPDYEDIFINGLGSRIDKGNFVNNQVSSLADSVRKSQSVKNNDLLKTAVNAAEEILTGPRAFMDSFFNPVTRAFETNMGRGLAGTLGGVTFNWLNENYGWETKFNSRAPIGVDISLTLSVIHDIPPGLDHSGYNRAPLYNVGNIMKEIAGDPNGRLDNAESNFNNQENKIQKSRK